MRITVDIDADLHVEAQAEARRAGTSVRAVVNDALRRSLRPVSPLIRPVPPLGRDPLTGLGIIETGRPVTADAVADALDD